MKASKSFTAVEEVDVEKLMRILEQKYLAKKVNETLLFMKTLSY